MKHIDNPTFGNPMTTYTTQEASRLITFDLDNGDSPALMTYENESNTETIQIHIDEVFDFEEASGEELLGDVLPDNLFANLLAWAEGEEILEHQIAPDTSLDISGTDWRVIETGGGCTALTFGKSENLVTSIYGARVPLKGEDVIVWHHGLQFRFQADAVPTFLNTYCATY